MPEEPPGGSGASEVPEGWEGIPSNWPPDPPPELPLFAMPSAWLFPFVILPLHVFEERYVQLVEDILDGQGRLVIGTFVDPGADPAGSPPIHPIAGMGEIGRHDRLPDGKYNLLVVGMRRVHVREVESERLYRRVTVEPAEEIPVAAEREEALKARLVKAILERTEGLSSIPPQVSVSHLTDLLTLRIPLPTDVLAELYPMLDEEARAEAVLEEHGRRPRLDPPEALGPG